VFHGFRGMVAAGLDNNTQGKWRRSVRRAVITAGLEGAYALHRGGLFSDAAGYGVIFTLHHVRPRQDIEEFGPNAHLEITPEFLDAAIQQLRDDGYTFAALQELPELLDNRTTHQRFAAFTLDDGYRNNMQHALPVFSRNKVPFTIFVNSGFAERTRSIWWETLAVLMTGRTEIHFDFGAGEERLDLSHTDAKFSAFDRFSDFIWKGDEEHALVQLDLLAKRHGIDPLGITDRLTLPPDDLKTLATEPLASLGAHTTSHRALSRLSDHDARVEMEHSASWIENLTGKRPTAVAYPYGSPRAAGPREYTIAQELGFRVGVTTRPGIINEKNTAIMTGLPRVSLNGFYQKGRYVSAMASGIPFAFKKR
jgi:peptidoglycan/xylan/chitin deacetylase (PgdA/CDA1 family)